MRAVIYGRVSKDRVAGRSVDEQLTEGRTWARREGWQVVAEHRDDGISASRFANGKTRPGWQSTMDLINGAQVDLLVVWEVSRASRDRAVWSALLAACQERKVRIATGGRIHDPADPDDGFMLDLLGSLAVRESGVTQKRILRTVAHRAAAGKPHGKIPYGYRRVYDETSRKLIRQEPHPQQAPVVREICRRLLAGEPLYSVAADLTTRGVPPPRLSRTWHPTQVKRIAINPTYAGLRAHHGRVTPAVWEGLIDEADQRVLAAKLTDPARKTWRDGSIKHLLVGIAMCGVCGGKCKLIRSRGTLSYTCQENFCVGRVQHALDAYITELVIGWASRPDAQELITATGDPEAADAADEARELRTKLEKFYVEAADLSPAGLAKIEARLLAKLRDAERRAVPRGLPPVLADFAGPTARERWDQLMITQRREVVRALLVPKVMRTGKATPRFRPDSIEIVWLHGEASL